MTHDQRTLTILVVGLFAVACFACALSCSDVKPDANRSNNAISVNACVEHGGIPLFSNYAREGEVAMMIECRIPSRLP